MIVNPKKTYLRSHRITCLTEMEDKLELITMFPGLSPLFLDTIKDLGILSRILKEEIDSCPEKVDEAHTDYQEFFGKLCEIQEVSL